jgi:hypothetical protein
MQKLTNHVSESISDTNFQSIFSQLHAPIFSLEEASSLERVNKAGEALSKFLSLYSR